MQDTELDTLACRAFRAAPQIIILAPGDPGGTLFHDAGAEFQVAGITATSWDPTTCVLYLRRFPPEPVPRREPGPPGCPG